MPFLAYEKRGVTRSKYFAHVRMKQIRHKKMKLLEN
jgi:hypothetical protein